MTFVPEWRLNSVSKNQHTTAGSKHRISYKSIDSMMSVDHLSLIGRQLMGHKYIFEAEMGLYVYYHEAQIHDEYSVQSVPYWDQLQYSDFLCPHLIKEFVRKPPNRFDLFALN